MSIIEVRILAGLFFVRISADSFLYEGYGRPLTGKAFDLLKGIINCFIIHFVL